eukprot:363531-Chlamydomonas_euryale.AAC.6
MDDSVTVPPPFQLRQDEAMDDSVTVPPPFQLRQHEAMDDSVTVPPPFQLRQHEAMDDSVTVYPPQLPPIPKPAAPFPPHLNLPTSPQPVAPFPPHLNLPTSPQPTISCPPQPPQLLTNAFVMPALTTSQPGAMGPLPLVEWAHVDDVDAIDGVPEAVGMAAPPASHKVAALSLPQCMFPLDGCGYG